MPIILIAHGLHSAIFVFYVAGAFKHFGINQHFAGFDCDT